MELVWGKVVLCVQLCYMFELLQGVVFYEGSCVVCMCEYIMYGLYYIDGVVLCGDDMCVGAVECRKVALYVGLCCMCVNFVLCDDCAMLGGYVMCEIVLDVRVTLYMSYGV